MHLPLRCSPSYVHLRFPLQLVCFQFLKREIDKLIRCDFHSHLTFRMKHKRHVRLRFPLRFARFPLKSKNSNRCVAIFIRALRLNNRNNRRIGKIMDHNSYYTIFRLSTYRTLLACGLLVDYSSKRFHRSSDAENEMHVSLCFFVCSSLQTSTLLV